MNINIIGDIDDYAYDRLIADIESNKDYGDAIYISINSCGGYVDVAQKMVVALIDLKMKSNLPIICTNSGNVMSSATLIWCLGDTRIWDDSKGEFLIHNPWMTTTGDAEQLRNNAEQLEQLQNEFAEMYSDVTGIPVDAVLEIMSYDEPIGSEDMITLNFTDEIIN